MDIDFFSLTIEGQILGVPVEMITKVEGISPLLLHDINHEIQRKSTNCVSKGWVYLGS